MFVHLLDSNGRLVAQKDAPPLDGAYPTSLWDVDEVVKESYDLAIPSESRGPYSIEIRMYSPSDLKRLAVGMGDHVLLVNAVP